MVNGIFYSARSYAFAKYWKYFMVRFAGAHAFGYNSAESESIWMKSGALGVHCRALVPAHFECNPRSSESGRARRIFVFVLSGKQRTKSPISRRPNFTKFA